MKTLRRFLPLGFLIASGFVAGVGCTQVQVAPSTLGEYKFGELQVWTDKDFATAYNAAKLGMKDLNLFLTEDEKKVIEGDLHGRDQADTLVIVKIKEVAKGRTSVKIRYGLQGNLSLAQKLYQAIEKHY
jgi:hypothetical protein